MADIESNIDLNIDTSSAAASIKSLQRQISAFQASMAKGSAANANAAANLQSNLLNNINATGKFAASMKTVKSTTESFTTALEKNQLSMGQYFKYAGGASKSFGKLFKSEFDTINKVARERVKDLQTQYIKLGRDANGAMKAISVRPLALDMDNLATKTAIAAQKQALMNQLLKQGSTSMLNFGKNTQWAGRQLMVGFTVPLMYLGTAAGKTFMKMEEQAIKFKRVYGDMFTTTGETDKALKNVQAMAKEFTKYGVAVEKTMGMAAEAAAAGKMGADLVAQVAEATRLSVLGNVEQQQALETTISLTNAFGVAAKDLKGDIDFLNAVENQTVTSIEDLTTAIPKAAPVIQQLGGNVKDLAFFLTAMKEGGINASEGANALKSGLASMINPTAKASQFLAGFGINLKGIVEANKGDVKGTIVQFAKALDTLDPLNRAQAIEQLFGKFQFARISTLFQNVIKEGSQAQRVLQLSASTTEELAVLSERELKRIEDSPMFKFKKAVEDLKVSIVPLGEAFVKAVTPIVEFATKVLDKFNEMDDGAKSFIIGLTAVLGGIGPIAIMSFGLLANGVAQIIKGFVAVKSVFNRAGQSTSTLGEQTNYLTTQQLEQAAVAASLEQSHQRLAQAFTSEKSALSALIAEYQRAVAAQSALRGPVGMGRPTRRMATGGVIKGPGTGTSDSIPAMLSNGEAVIPADKAKQYAPLVSGIIAGNIPGFAQGRTEFAHIGSGTTAGFATLAKTLSAFPDSISTRLMKVLQAGAKIFGDSVRVNLYGSLGIRTGQTTGGQSINNLLGKQGVSKAEFMQDWDKQGIARWKTALKNSGLKLDEVHADLIQLDAGMKDYIMSLNDQDNVTDKQVKEAYDYSTKQRVAGTRVAAEFDKLAVTAGEARVNIAQSTQAKFGLPMAPGGGSKGAAFIGETKVRRGGDRFPFYQKLGFDLTNLAKTEMAIGAKNALDINSPSKVMRTVGQEAGKGFKLGAAEYIDDARAVGQQIGAAEVSGTQSGALTAGLQPGVRGRRSAVQKGSKASKGPVSGGRMAGVGMAASGVMMAASMIPGKVGEAAQSLMMPMMALSMILPMLTSGVGAAIVAIGLIAGSIIALKVQFDEAQSSALKMSEAMGTGTKTIEEYAKFAGKASAGEIMDKRRANRMSMFQIQSGKKTFGQSYAESEQGQQKMKDVRASMAGVGRGATVTQMVNQMASAVAAGALDPAQARSIVANLATEMQDMSFGMQVNAQLNEIIGPNGENLSKDPLQVRMNLMENTRQGLAKSSKSLSGAMSVTGGDVGRFGGGAIAGGLAGAGGGALAGMAIGAAGGPIGVIGGAIVGAITGVVAGAIVGSIERSNRIAKASGAMVGLQKEALQQQQEMIDSLDLTYQQKIAEAKAAGDVAEAERLTNEYLKARPELLAAQGRLTKDIQGSYEGAGAGLGLQMFGLGGAREAMNAGADKAIQSTFKGTANEDMANLVTSQIKDANLTDAQDYTMRIAFSTGDIDPLLLNGFLTQFGSDKGTMQKTMNIITTMGGAFAADTMQVMNMFVDKDGNPLVKQQTEFIANISSKSPEDASKYLDVFLNAKNLGEVVDLGFTMSFYLKNPQAQHALADAQKMIDEHNGKMDMKFVASVIGKDNLDAVVRAGTEFTNLDAEQQKIFTTTMKSMLLMEGDPAMVSAYQGWLKENGFSEKDKPFEDYAATKAIQVTKASADTSKALGTATKPTSSGSGSKQDPYADILKSLQNVRNASINAAGGAKELLRILGGTKDLKAFTGIGEQLIGKGGSASFADAMMSADKATQKLFFTIKNGIVTLTALGKAMKKAYDEKILGDFALAQKRSIADVSNQITAFTKLKNAGMGLTEASEMVNDAELAGAIARAKSSKEINQLINDYYLLAEAKEKLAMLTPEGMQEVFNKGFDMAMEQFSAKEQAIEIAFKIKNKADLDAITGAESQIAAINYQIDDQEALLVGIADKEQEINDKYDEKAKALEQVKKLNQDIINQQKAQLNIADALSSGDLSAAAKAVQDSRAQNAMAALEAQGNMLEQSRQAELASVTASNGKTRKQIEADIKKLKNDIFTIEENTLEPARERIRLAEEQKAKDLALVTVAGQTKEQWEAIKNRTDLARTADEKYNIAIQKSLDIAKDLVSKWEALNKTYTTTHKVVTINDSAAGGTGGTGGSGSGSGSGAGAGAGAGAGSGSGSGSGAGSPAPTPALGSQANPYKTNIMPGMSLASDSNILNIPVNKYGKLPSGYYVHGLRDNGSSGTLTFGYSKNLNPLTGKPLKTSGAVVKMERGFDGKLTPWQKFAEGGLINSVVGGKLSGMGTDTVPVAGTPGEFVVNAAATRANRGLLSSINSGAFSMSDLKSPSFSKERYSLPEQAYPEAASFSSGGSSSSAESETSTSNSVYNYNLSVNVEGSSSSADEIANVVMRKLQTSRNQQVKRQVIR